MKNLKKHPRKQLEKFSTVFMQLGLVLTLFVVYVVIEHETSEKKIVACDFNPDEDIYAIDDSRTVIFKKEVIKPKAVTESKPKKVTNLSQIDKSDEVDVIETVIDKPTDIKPQIVNPNDIVEVPEDPVIDPNDDPKSIFLVEEAPIYRGCEGLSKEENKKCFVKKITKHVQRHFNSSLSEDLGLRSGKHRISTEFIIGKSGKIVGVRIRAPHKRLEKEAQRIVDKIPQFTPGKQQGKPVKVKYTLPITFYVE